MAYTDNKHWKGTQHHTHTHSHTH